MTFTAHLGGSPFNVAIGLARLNRPSTLMARFSRDSFGRRLRAHAENNGVDVSHAAEAAENTTLAVVDLGPSGDATYLFYRTDTAGGCESMAHGDYIVVRSNGGQVCKGDIAETFDPIARVPTGSCSYGDFTPYRRP